MIYLLVFLFGAVLTTLGFVGMIHIEDVESGWGRYFSFLVCAGTMTSMFTMFSFIMDRLEAAMFRRRDRLRRQNKGS